MEFLILIFFPCMYTYMYIKVIHAVCLQRWKCNDVGIIATEGA
jgi:hypothetical protein